MFTVDSSAAQYTPYVTVDSSTGEAWGGVSAQRDEEPAALPGKFRPAYFPAGVPLMFMGVPAKRSGREAEEHLAGVAADVSAYAHLRDHHVARVQPKEKVPLSSRWFVMPGATK